MNILKNFGLGLALLIALVPMAWSSPSVAELLQKEDEIQDLSTTDFTSKVSLTQQKKDQGTKAFETILYRRDKTDNFLMIMIAPEADKGNGYLRTGDNMWMYRINTRTFQHINRDESISGTDSKTGDFEKRKLFEIYKAALDTGGKEVIAEEMLGKIPVYRFEIIGKVNDVTYPKKIYWVRKDNYLPLKVQDFSLSQTLMQSEYYPKWTTVEGRFVPLQMIFVDEFEKGNKTIVELSGITLQHLDDSIFTKAYLENLSK